MAYINAYKKAAPCLCSPRTGEKTVWLSEPSRPPGHFGSGVCFCSVFMRTAYYSTMSGIPSTGHLAGDEGEAILSPWSSRVCASAILFELICSPACLTLLFKIVPRRTERKEPFHPMMQMGPSQTHLPLTLNVAFHSDIVTMQPEGQLSTTTQLPGWRRPSRGEESGED